jgi:hypothetical protein
MTSQRRARITATLVAFVAALATAAYLFAGATRYISWREWILNGGGAYVYFTYPAGAALAGYLSAWGAIRWRGAPATILVAVLSSLVGVIIAVPVSQFLDCHFWGCSNISSDFLAFRFEIETPFIWLLLAIMTTILALLARRIAGPVSP